MTSRGSNLLSFSADDTSMKTRKATARHVKGAIYIHNTVCKLITRSIPGNEYKRCTKNHSEIGNSYSC